MFVGGVTRAIGPCILAVILLLGLASADAFAANDRRVALVIGNGAYGHFPKLTNPPRDAALMAAKLRSVGFDVDLAIDDDQHSLKQRVRAFGVRARGASAALFYYAGHGLQVEGRNYLLPADAKLRSVTDLKAQSLHLSTVSDELDAADAKISLIILDACRDNPLPRLLAGKSGTRSLKLTRGLASIKRASGRLVAYATAPGEVAYDGGDGMQNSPFTQAVADWIEEPGLEVGHMFQQVREQVIAATDGKQVPWIEEAILGDFYFRPMAPESTPVAALPTPEPAVLDLFKSHERIQSSRPSGPLAPVSPSNNEIETAWSETTVLGTRDAYIQFLERYPESRFAQQAVAMLLELASPIALAPVPKAPVPKTAPPPDVVKDQARAEPSRPSAAERPEPQRSEPRRTEPQPPDAKPVDQITAAWSKATALDTRDAYLAFLEQYPESDYAQQAVAMLLEFASPKASAATAGQLAPQ